MSIVTLNDLLERLGATERTEALAILRRHFAAFGRSEDMDALMYGESRDVPDRLLASLNNAVIFNLSEDSKRFIQATMDLQNAGLTTEQICEKYKLREALIREEQNTEPFRNYAATLRKSDLQQRGHQFMAMLLHVLTEQLKAQPIATLERLASASKMPVGEWIAKALPGHVNGESSGMVIDAQYTETASGTDTDTANSSTA